MNAVWIACSVALGVVALGAVSYANRVIRVSRRVLWESHTLYQNHRVETLDKVTAIFRAKKLDEQERAVTSMLQHISADPLTELRARAGVDS